MPLSDAQRARFREELERKGVTSEKAASIKAKWPSGRKAGKPLSDTYINQVFNKGRGSYQGIKLFADALSLDYPYIIDGRRTISAPTADPKSPASAPAAPHPDYDALVALIQAALLLCGAKPPAASSLAETVVATWKAQQSHD